MPYAPPNSSTRPPGKPITLYYEEQGNSSDMPLLLIMGLSSQLIAWPQDLVDDLVSRGFRVIRLDNRDCGLSTHLDGVALNPIWNPSAAPYFLSDMADDAASLLTHLGVEKAHVVGASMGGMIAQLLTLDHPTQVSSLCSIMSTTGNPGVGRPTPQAWAAVSEPVPTEREAAITHLVGVLAVIGSQTHPLDPGEARRQVGEAYDRAFYPEGTGRQSRAILAAVDRTTRLRNEVKVPTVVIHGREDSLIDVSGGKATADAIPGAVFLSVGMDMALGLAGMGHDLPAHLWPTIADAIEDNTKKAGA
jgi:pimeloyl-ACP methyl ester carboxylesterase